ncbi:MAG: ATP-binding protein [Gammaproteobacteria bacterium]
MARSLYTKLAISLAGLFGLVAVIFVLLLGQASERYQQEVAQKLNATLAEHIVAEHRLIRDGEIDQAALEHLFHSLMVINPKVELYLLDARGRILAYSAPPGKVRRESVDMQPVRRFVNQDYTPPLSGDDPRNPERRKVFSAAPIEVAGRRLGYLYVILASEQYDSVAQMLAGSYVFKINALLSLVAVVFALLAALLLFALLTRRLRRLTQKVEEFQRAGFTGTLPQGRHNGDEIERLTRSINAMAMRIAGQVRHLREIDSQRRELVANVSHDLRTPLASLQGYLETLRLKGEELAAAERLHYTDIAHRHCRHLGRLVEQLFDLARLDANEIQPVLEPFSLPELVQDVVQKFELRARQREVALQARYDANLPFVIGDIALIERVMDNLIENALRHTPAGGAVTVAVQPVGETLAVQIIDTGPGIAAEDLPNIFERFYQSDRMRPQGGAGLGLAIARRIVELHGRDIRTASTLGRGTTFAFDLPVQMAH